MRLTSRPRAFSIYLVRPPEILFGMTHNYEGEKRGTIEQPCSKAEEVNQATNVARNDHTDGQNCLLKMVHDVVKEMIYGHAVKLKMFINAVWMDHTKNQNRLSLLLKNISL